ncbi:MAG: hypothetical protein ACXQS5_05105, partial [Candidatus Methanospirareceae archaeon]
TPDEIVRFAKEWDFSAPLVIVPTTYPMLTLEEIKQLGIKIKNILRELGIATAEEIYKKVAFTRIPETDMG